VCITSERNNPNNGDKEILLELLPAEGFGTVESGVWRFILHGVRVRVGRFDAWAVTDAELRSDLEPVGRRVAMPGTARNAITVGAHVSRDSWVDVNGRQRQVSARVGDIASFSSDGPTRDGRLKPEITAPGQEIGSSYSADAPAGSPYSIFPSDSWVLWDGLHAVGQGTSFSAPHVAGAVALIFERDPALDALQVREIITSTARADGFTGAVPNATWGFGKLDVYAALERMGAVASSFKVYLPLMAVDR
jgi:subtilisin family serine protease